MALSAAYLLGSFYEEEFKLESAEIFFRRAMIGYTRSLGAAHSSTQDASRRLAHARSLQRPNEENSIILSDSEASGTSSGIGGTSQPPSFVSSVSAILPQAKMEVFIMGLAHLFLKDDDVRGTVQKAFERSKDELKFDRSRMERNFTRILRRYSKELIQRSNGSMKRDTAKSVRNNSRSIAIAVFRIVRLISSAQLPTAIILSQPVEKLMLDRFFENAPTLEEVSKTEAANSRPLHWQVEQGKIEEVDSSSDGSENPHVNKFHIEHSVEMVELFMISGEPFMNLKRRFQDFVARGTLDDVLNDVKILGHQQDGLSPSLSYTDNGLVRV